MSETAEASRTRTLLLVGAAVIALAALVVFVVLPLLGGGDEDPDVDVVVPDRATEGPTESPTDDFGLTDPDSVDGEDPPAETFEVFNARDPFQQLVREGAGGGGGDTTTPTDGTDPGPGLPDPGTGGGGITPSPSPSPSPGTDGTGGTGGDGDGDTGGNGGSDGTGGSGGNGGTGGGNGESADVGGTTVTLVDVFTDDDGERKATVTVNGTGYTVGEGDTFARRFRLLDISGRCSTMLFGDNRFTLCEGERIRK